MRAPTPSRSFRSKAVFLAFAAAANLPQFAVAQDVVVSEEKAPNTIGAATAVRTKAVVIGIDVASSRATLRGSGGRVFDVTVSPEVGDLRKLRIGDNVDIAYRASLLIHADKVKSNGIRERVETDTVSPASGGVAASTHSVQVLATIEKVDLKRRLVTLRGALRTVTVQAAPDVPIEALRVGDSVRAELVTATALHVTRNDASLN